VPSRRLPAVVWALVFINAAIFLHEAGLAPGALQLFMDRYALVPARLTMTSGLAQFWPTLITSMFLHGSWLHIIGNMWFLWIFGDNVEDSFGSFAFLIFYLTCGISASLVQFAAEPLSRVPTIGASGAIAGVMGAYLVLYPRARVLTLIPFIFYFTMEIPAFVMLVYWFVIQFFSGVTSLGMSHSSGGVAFWAHVGGFIVGLLLTTVFRRPARTSRSNYYHYDR